MTIKINGNRINGGRQSATGVRETRAVRNIEIRATGTDDAPGVTLRAIRPGVVDDYGSLWEPDAFDESLEERLPTLCWAHNWSEPLGPGLAFRTSSDGPDIDFGFSDFDAVPQARRAHAQVVDGTIQDCSVGFWDAQRRDPTDEEVKKYPGIREVIIKAKLDEVSLVLRGAVPGANVMGVRSPQGSVDAAIELARRVAEGEITSDEAKAAWDLMVVDGEAAAGGTGEQEQQEPDPVDHAALDAETDAVLASLDRSRRR